MRTWLGRLIPILTLCFFPFCSVDAQTLGEALDAAELVWTTGGDNGGWYSQNGNTYDDVDAAESNYTPPYKENWVETSVTGPIAICFWWEIENYYDEELVFAIDGVRQESINNNSNWRYAACIVPAGTHSLRWTLNGSTWVPDGWGYGRLDQVMLSPVAPEIEVLGANSSVVSNGTATTSITNGTDFGSVFLTGSAVTQRFYLRNSGFADLMASTVTVSGVHGGDFEMLGCPPVVRPGTQSNLYIRFDPSALGGRTAIVAVANNDADEGSYSFAVSGTGIADGSYIRVLGGASLAMPITNGSVAVTNTMGTDFGMQYLTGFSTSRTFAVSNAGNSTLNISAVNLAGANPADFRVISFPSTVAAGTRSNIFIQFDPLAIGTRAAVVEIASDDADSPSYTFAIGGICIPDAPIILLLGNGLNWDGGGWKHWANFGGAPAFSGVVERVWTITNSGSANLIISNVTLQGAGAVHFSVPAYPALVSPGTGSNLVVRFAPAAAGLSTAVVAIANNDKNPVEIYIEGKGTSTHFVWTNSPSPTPPYLTWESAAHTIQDAASICVDGDDIWVTNGVYDSGSVVVDGVTNRVGITNAIPLRSINGPEVTRIVGDSTMRGVYLTSGATLSGFTITNGHASNGGGVYGGVVSNCVISGNQASNGGGVCYAVLYDSQIIGNVAEDIGGGALGGTLLRCLLANNQAGGAVYSIPGYFPPYSYNIWGASGGGGAYGSDLYSCLIVNNIAFSGGGANGGNLYNCTVSGNRASGNAYAGGGIFGTDYVWNSIVYGNIASNHIDDNWGCEYIDALFITLYPYFYYSCSQPASSVGDWSITNDPGFVTGAFQLSAASPCINTGNNEPFTLGSTDLAGQPRICGGRVDMGAYEYAPGPDTGDYDGDGIPNDWESRLGLNPAVSNSPSMDSDGDGRPDIEEYVADTQPKNSASYFPLVELTSPPLGMMVLVVDPTSTARVYGVHWITNLLAAPQIWTLIPPEKTGSGSAVTFTVTNDGPGRIYRTGVRLP